MSGFKELAALYRSILRIHRHKLPGPMRTLGDSYLQEEFRRHLKGKTTPEQWQVFAKEWRGYLSMLQGAADAGDRSGYLSGHVLQSMTPEQLEQLDALKQAAQDLGRSLKAQLEQPASQPLDSNSSNNRG